VKLLVRAAEPVGQRRCGRSRSPGRAAANCSRSRA
jgi:hypothetical protein